MFLLRGLWRRGGRSGLCRPYPLYRLFCWARTRCGREASRRLGPRRAWGRFCWLRGRRVWGRPCINVPSALLHSSSSYINLKVRRRGKRRGEYTNVHESSHARNSHPVTQFQYPATPHHRYPIACGSTSRCRYCIGDN